MVENSTVVFLTSICGEKTYFLMFFYTFFCCFHTFFLLLYKLNYIAMKKIFVLSFVLIALCAQGAVKVTTQHFEAADSVRFFDPNETESEGFKFVKTVSADWPVTINGNKSKALNDFLIEEVFYASHNPNFPQKSVNDVKSLSDCVKNWVKYILHDNVMLNEYVVKDYGTPGVKDLNSEEYPMNSWYDATEFKLSHVVGNLVFFVEYNEIYYGGAHPDFMYTYYAFDTALNRPIRMDDVITSRTKLLRLLPKYDKRDKESKWWQEIQTVDLGNFYIKDGNMVFSFTPYAIGPFCDGQIDVKVPLKTLRAKGLLTTYGKKLK